MTDQKWIALLGFLVTACGLLAVFPPLVQYSQWFSLIGALIGAFVAAWFGIKPAIAASRAKAAAAKATSK